MSEYAMTPSERRKLSGKKIALGGYAALPGTGPAGETCRTCAHICRKRMAKTYIKCALMQARWTGGGGTDIKANAPACSKWQAAVCEWTKYMNGAATTSCQAIYCLEVGDKSPGDDCPLCWNPIKFKTEAQR